MTTLRGSCQCGTIKFHLDGDPKWVAHCHCNDCRRATSAAVSTFVGCDRKKVTFDEGEPATYKSSEGVRRTFCRGCGSPIAYEGARWAGEIHFYVGLFEHPEKLTPNREGYLKERLPWLHIDVSE